MPYRLRNRQMQIPNGLVYFQPQTKWSTAPNSSFDSIVNQVIAHRNGNSWLIEKFGLSTDPAQVAVEVDEYNAQICYSMGWGDYIHGVESPPPFGHHPASPLSRLGSVAAGARTMIDWVRSRDEAVPREQANNRALTCIKCPANDDGDWSSYFTVPAQEVIRVELEKKRKWDLKTEHDDKISVCQVCLCPLKLKVHVPLRHILNNIPDDVRLRLPSNCWIITEKPE